MSTFFHNELAAFLKRCMQQQPHPDDTTKFMDPHNKEDCLAYLQFVDDDETYGLVSHGSWLFLSCDYIMFQRNQFTQPPHLRGSIILICS